MDARYKVSGDARNFADGPGVLPEVDEIPEVREKGASRNSSPPPPDGTTHSTVRPSLRPAHRR